MSLQQRVDLLTRAFMAGRMEEVVQFCSDTLTVYGADGILRFCGPDEVLVGLRHHRDKAFGEGLRGLSGRVVAQSINRTGRFQFFVHWCYDMGDHAPARHAESRYFCTPHNGIQRVEMIEFRSLAFADVMAWYPAHRIGGAFEAATV